MDTPVPIRTLKLSLSGHWMGNHSIEFDVKGFVMYNEIGFVMILKVLS